MSRTKKLGRARVRIAKLERDLANSQAATREAMALYYRVAHWLERRERELREIQENVVPAIARIVNIRIGGVWLIPVPPPICYNVPEFDALSFVPLVTRRIDTGRLLEVAYRVRGEVLNETFHGANAPNLVRDYIGDIGKLLMLKAIDAVLAASQPEAAPVGAKAGDA